MKKEVVALRHVQFEDLGSFEKVFKDRGYRVAYLDVGKDDISRVDKIDPEIVVICGGPISVNDENFYPFLLDEFKMVEKRFKEKKRILGLCLGAQMMAKILGAKVYRAKEKEIGWLPVSLTKEGQKSALRFLGEGNLFHWHGETFDLPKQSCLLASTSICENQAFSFQNSLALQFHPEILAAHLELWLIGHTCELSQIPQIDLHQMRREAKQFAPLLQLQSAKFLNEWLDLPFEINF